MESRVPLLPIVTLVVPMVNVPVLPLPAIPTPPTVEVVEKAESGKVKAESKSAARIKKVFFMADWLGFMGVYVVNSVPVSVHVMPSALTWILLPWVIGTRRQLAPT